MQFVKQTTNNYNRTADAIQKIILHMSKDLIKDSDFKKWLVELKTRIRQSQVKAMIKVNNEMLRLY